MPVNITMPQQSDTMTEGTVVKWLKQEGEKVKAGEIIAEIETDKATMEMEAFESGTLAQILVKEGEKVPVGSTLAVLATGSEDPKKVGTSTTPREAGAPKVPSAAPSASTAPAAPPSKPQTKTSYQYDLLVIGGGPAGYAAAIRAGQLGKRVLCVEKENLGGTCLNWGCIPTKALLESGAFVRKLRTEAVEWGVSFDNLKVDFSKAISRSRGIADKLTKGIAHLFKKYLVASESGVGEIIEPHKVRITAPGGSTKDVTAANVIIATGARSRSLPGVEFDGKTIINSRDAMILPALPKRLAIIGAGAIGCEFADFYSAMGADVRIIEMLPHLLPIEDDDVSITLERVFSKRGIHIHTHTKTDKVEKTPGGVKLTITCPKETQIVEADVLLIAVGVTGNVENVAAKSLNLELVKNHVKVDKEYKTNVENVWAVGDVIGPPWLAHVAHHEAVMCVERIFGQGEHTIDYKNIPGCTYTHPQVASMGLTERAAREQKLAIKIGKFPFMASGRALAAGETDGFVKLIFSEQYGELLGVHMIGEHVTEMLSELVMAKKLEATMDEIISAMHPHPTLSEAVMEAAGIAGGRAIHF